MWFSSLIWEILHPIQTVKVRVRKPLLAYYDRISSKYKKKSQDGAILMREVLIKVGIITLVASVIIWISAFIYVAFYYSYMPTIKHTRPVHIQYNSCNEDKGICSYPSAYVQLTKRNRLMMIGQVYKITLNIEMPESEINRNLGMFMSCLELRSQSGVLEASSCRSGILKYRSSIFNFIASVIMIPVMLMGTYTEKQIIQLEMFSNFKDDQNNPVTEIYVEIQSKHLELYTASIDIEAHFTGMRYFMFNWPYLSAAIGIGTNLCFMAIICALSWYHLYSSTTIEGDHSSNSNFLIEDMKKVDKIDIKTELLDLKQEDDSQISGDLSFIEDLVSEEIIKVEKYN